MYLHKYFHPVNHAFLTPRSGDDQGAHDFPLSVVGDGDDLYHITISNPAVWPENYCCSELTPLGRRDPSCQGPNSRLVFLPHGHLELQANGRIILSTLDEAFGVCGTSWTFQFRQTSGMQFYGMGEKSTPFEKSGRTHKFWNTDAWADFHGHAVEHGHYDPDYISVPYVIIKQGNTYTGLLIDNPYPSVISIAAQPNISNQSQAIDVPTNKIYLGSENGAPSLYIIYGPSLPELTRKLQTLVGRTPLPPLWAIGHHQCRWGYGGIEDLRYLADNFEKHRFPVDGLWLDIDYMVGYRVFTIDRAKFPDPATDIKSITDRGFRVVPIVDPGVKQDPGYPVHDTGIASDVFCKNAAGRDFVGMVWPGFTLFPDFSLPHAQEWWADHFAQLLGHGFAGAWLDMNDPSTGTVECTGMRFRNGTAPHEAFHNQYALLMAKASHRGALLANPDKRPFLLSRSGFTGSQKYAAHWTGDNTSNYHHLAICIGKSINLALSGMPFNGPDVGGFGGNTTEQLMLDWMKACFLFPFSRNHSCAGTRRQEPWQFSRSALHVLRHLVRLRYTLLPYLYNLFIDQEERGEAILRPLFYDFPDGDHLSLCTIDDQFMIGPAIMQAPFVVEKQTSRTVALPAAYWYRADTAEWLEGDRMITVTKQRSSTPVFLREGAVIALQAGIRESNRADLTNVQLLICARQGSSGRWTFRYSVDDGETFAYRTVGRSTYEITAAVEGGNLVLDIACLDKGYGPVRFTPVTLEPFDAVIVRRTGQEEIPARPRARKVRLFGPEQTVWLWSS